MFLCFSDHQITVWNRLCKRSKESGVHIHPEIKVLTDTGYQGFDKLHYNSELPKKNTKKRPLSRKDKKKNRQLSSERVLNENLIGMIKRFKIIYISIYVTNNFDRTYKSNLYLYFLL